MPEPNVGTSGTPRGSATMRRSFPVAAGYRMASWSTGSTAVTPVVCVQGAGTSSRPLLPLVERLGASVETWAVDLPGFGQSSQPAEPLGLTALGEALSDWLEAVELPPACLLGSSFGCQVVTEVA